ncbi:hypothetical protein [Streptomyces griseiscabiei]|uniref:Uncharacterized protein n=1 Tax=Streptomyces griseiscabiei TaxID=2993540 RepID=A0ABU4L772_9ACTN|nr:hypothetical protein [Streptomyces griseiscabiei]MBZ3901826.1 hypothetical protein [Streptomyces griseiscabiei]MDX2910974.1 hypothetical protein [Streptomyces griseiscabiei]
MLTDHANEDSRLSFWARVREFAVPPSMIETATARRAVGDWAGACAAAGIDLDLGLRAVTSRHGRELTSQVRDDLRHLAPDLLRWHMPRIAPDGLLRPGLTVTLARYRAAGRAGPHPVHLVARTPPAWADAGQRIGLALWDGSRDGSLTGNGARGHPHPRPSRRYRLDLHRHLWDARRAAELRLRSGADRPGPVPPRSYEAGAGRLGPDDPALVASGRGCAVERWADEAAIVLRAEGRSSGTVLVRYGARRRLLLDLGTAPTSLRITPLSGDDGAVGSLPVLPDAATWLAPDLELIRAGAVDADRLHPLVASALVPDQVRAGPAEPPDRAGQPRIVECRGERHRIGLVDGVLVALDHDPAQLRREELLVELTGTPLPCLRAIDEAHRRPDCLSGVRERLDHGDIAGALAVVEGLLGPEAVLRDGALRDELESAAQRRIAYGLYRAGLTDLTRDRVRSNGGRRPSRQRRPRVATFF